MKILPVIFGLLVIAVLWRFVNVWAGIAAGVAAFWLAYLLLNQPVKK